MNTLIYRQNEKVDWIAGGGARRLLWVQAVLVVVLLIVATWQRNQIIHLGYETEQMARSQEEALQIHRWLQVEAESLSAVKRIEQVAMRQLQMKSGQPQERIYMTTPVGVVASVSLDTEVARMADAR